MTTIAYKDGTLAADSRVTVDSEAGGSRNFLCDKLFRKIVPVGDSMEEVIIATAGESFSGMVFVDWYGSGQPPPDNLIVGEADFTVLVLTQAGLFEYDRWCRGIEVKDKFYAVGSGTKVALGAMAMGASAKRAVEIACEFDPYTAPPVLTMRLRKTKTITEGEQNAD